MILDRLEKANQYVALHPLFEQSFAFLSRLDLCNLPAGRHELAGDRLFAIVDRAVGCGREQSLLEFHRQYIDIQFVVAGADSIGWRPLADCNRISVKYDPEKDVGFYFDRPDTWLFVPAGAFAIFFPQDAHAPLGCDGNVHKVVLKIAQSAQ